MSDEANRLKALFARLPRMDIIHLEDSPKLGLGAVERPGSKGGTHKGLIVISDATDRSKEPLFAIQADAETIEAIQGQLGEIVGELRQLDSTLGKSGMEQGL